MHRHGRPSLSSGCSTQDASPHPGPQMNGQLRKPRQLPCGVKVACGLHGGKARSGQWEEAFEVVHLEGSTGVPSILGLPCVSAAVGSPHLVARLDPVPSLDIHFCHCTQGLPLCWVHTLSICVLDTSRRSLLILAPPVGVCRPPPRTGLLLCGCRSSEPPCLRGGGWWHPRAECSQTARCRGGVCQCVPR